MDEQRRRMRKEIQHMTALCSLTILQGPAQHEAQLAHRTGEMSTSQQGEKKSEKQGLVRWTNVFIALMIYND